MSNFKCPCCCHVTQQEILSVDSLGTKIVKGQTILREVQKCSVCGFSEKHQKFNGSPLEVLSDNFAYSENFKDFSRYRFIDAWSYANSVFFVIVEPASLPNDSVLVRYFMKRLRNIPYETPKEFARFFLTEQQTVYYGLDGDEKWVKRKLKYALEDLPLSMNGKNTICLTPKKTVVYLMERINRNVGIVRTTWGLGDMRAATFCGDMESLMREELIK